MDWIRGFVGSVFLAVTLGLCGLNWTTPASAQQIVVQGANVDPATLKPYFSGTDPASIERGVEDLKATGIYSDVSAKLVDGKIVVNLSGGAQVINRVAFEGNKQIETKQLEVEVQSKPHTTYNEETAVGDIGRIKDAYKKYGRNEAKVTKGWSNCRTDAWIWSSPSTKAARRASARSSLSATMPFRTTALAA
jgi:outer membrane protein insertion porin family